VLSKALAEVKVPDMLTLFTNGMSGDINHVDVSEPPSLNSRAESIRVGTILAADVLKSYKRLTAVTPSRLIARTRAVALPTPMFSRGDAASARQIISRFGKPGAPAFHEVVHAWKVLDVTALDGKPLDTEVQVIALGDELAWVGMPGDAFVELGLAVKQNSPYRHTIVSEQSSSGANTLRIAKRSRKVPTR